MSPEIADRQLSAGAWAVTVANIAQAAALRHLGAQRILIANQVVDPAAIRWLRHQIDSDNSFTPYCYIDSEVGIALLEGHLTGRQQDRPLPVLIEFGIPGGRGGVRTISEAERLAAMVRRSPGLRLAGVSGFEGIVGTGLEPETLSTVQRYLDDLRDCADAVVGAGDPTQPEDDPFIVTAGGSQFFELVRDTFNASWRAGRDLRVVLRSGCYVVHDDGVIQSYRTLMAHHGEPLYLEPALELWARVLSVPEPGLAIFDFGRRDTGSDAGMPVARYLFAIGSAAVAPAPAGTVVGLNDQHAYLRADTKHSQPGSDWLRVGDMVGFGISHACTTFDKWRLIPIGDADRRLLGVARTLF